MSSKKEKLKKKIEEKKIRDDIMQGVKVRKVDNKAAPVEEPSKVPGQKNVKSSKFKVSKDEKTGSYCMDPVDKETGQ